MPIWVIAVEYDGSDLHPHRPEPRRPVLEHAYDLESGRLAHGDDRLRVGSERPTRGWPMPPQLTRCAGCSVAVLALVTGRIADVVGRVATDVTRWAAWLTDAHEDDVWLWDPPPASLA